LAIPEPCDFNVAGVEPTHRADQDIVVLQGFVFLRNTQSPWTQLVEKRQRN
jgi:hypothetical protein